jgi:two-component system response regulator
MTTKVLLIEDNPSDEKLTVHALKKGNLDNEIVVVRDGAEAIDYLFGGAELPTLVLLDLKLPRIDGLEVLRRVRADPRTSLLPVVVLTASREEEDITRSYALGANAYVRKPVDFKEFIEAAKTLGLFWLLLNQTAPRTG